jgi:hypothetical protein
VERSAIHLPPAVVPVSRFVEANPHRLVVVEAIRSVVSAVLAVMVSLVSLAAMSVVASVPPVCLSAVVAGLAGEVGSRPVACREATATPPAASKLAEQVRSFVAELLAVR